jgi:hypothetical protein
VDIDLAPELGDLRRSRTNLEHPPKRVAPLGEQFRRGAIFGLKAQSTQTERRRTPHAIILRPFQRRRKRPEDERHKAPRFAVDMSDNEALASGRPETSWTIGSFDR